jgi:RimJ/RimL family protein N-acetyltransferase
LFTRFNTSIFIELFKNLPLKKIITNRLYLLPFTLEICKELLKGNNSILSLYDLKPSTNWPDQDMLETLPRIIINLQKVSEPTGFESWLIINKQNRSIIGDIGFKGEPNPEGVIDIGYGIIEQERQKGYASEAAKGLINWAFTQPYVKSISAQSLSSNIGSAKTLERLSFYKTGKKGNFLQWRLFKESWIKITKQTIIVIILTICLSSCSGNKDYVKLSNDHLTELIKKDILNTKVYKILSPKGEVINYQKATQYPASEFFTDRYLDKKNDSIILKIRKITKTDKSFNQTLNLYYTYGTYVDTINSKITINCDNIDSLLKKASIADKANRLNQTIDIQIDALNQRLLFNIFDSCDFHTMIKNKQETSFNALLILLHSNNLYQKKYIHHIKKAVKLGYLKPKHLAYLYDKIALGDNLPQKYATQTTLNQNGETILLPYDNLNKVNKRRLKIGLEAIKQE